MIITKKKKGIVGPHSSSGVKKGKWSAVLLAWKLRWYRTYIVKQKIFVRCKVTNQNTKQLYNRWHIFYHHSSSVQSALEVLLFWRWVDVVVALLFWVYTKMKNKREAEERHVSIARIAVCVCELCLSCSCIWYISNKMYIYNTHMCGLWILLLCMFVVYIYICFVSYKAFFFLSWLTFFFFLDTINNKPRRAKKKKKRIMQQKI